MTVRKPKPTLETRTVDKLIPYARNARTHDDSQVAQIAAKAEMAKLAAKAKKPPARKYRKKGELTPPEADDSAAKDKGGRPRKLIPDHETLTKIEGLGQLQCTIKEMAAFLSVSTRTVETFLEDPLDPDDPDSRTVRDVFETGKASGQVSLRRKQMRLADKSAAMAIFLGKNYLDQVDTQQITGPNGGPLQVELGVIRERLAGKIDSFGAAIAASAPDPVAADD